MITLSKFLWARSTDPLAAHCQRAIALLLQGVALHAVVGEPSTYQQFRADMDGLQSRLTQVTDESDLMLTVGAVLKALEQYNRETSRVIQLQSSELQEAIAQLTGAISVLSNASSESIDRLQQIERKLLAASELINIRELRLKLSECLQSMAAEVKRQGEDSHRSVSALRSGLSNMESRMANAQTGNAVDPVTGLPGRNEAEAALAAALESSPPAIVAVIVLTRVRQINLRLGYAVGDSAMSFFSDYVGSGLESTDTLYRWNGPVFVAILRRKESGLRVEQSLKRLLSSKLEHQLDLGTRTVLVPLTCRWAAWPVAAPLASLVRDMDRFALEQSPADSH